MSWGDIMTGDGDGDSVRSRLAEFFPTLGLRFECDKCGKPCKRDSAADYAAGAFHEGTGAERPTWYCSDCDTHYRREDSDGPTFDPFSD